MTNPEAMRGLTRLADDMVEQIDRGLNLSPFVQGDLEARIRFWATLMAKVQARYHDELVELVGRVERS